MARGRGGGNLTRPRKGTPHPKPALLDLSRPGARFLFISDVGYVVGLKTEPRKINIATYEALIEKGWITQPPVEAGEFITECFITPKGKRVASKLQIKDTGYDQEVFDEFKEFLYIEEEVQEENTPGIAQEALF